MWIGEQRISLKNMSKNQRAYWREIKRLYDQSINDGYNTTGQEWIETYAHGGEISKEDIKLAKELSSEKLLGYSKDFDYYKQRVDNLIQMFSQIEITRRQTRLTKGQRTKLAVANMLGNLREKFGDKAVWNGWQNLPYELRAKANSSEAADRYDGTNAILDMLDAYVENAFFSQIDEETSQEDYDDDEEFNGAGEYYGDDYE